MRVEWLATMTIGEIIGQILAGLAAVSFLVQISPIKLNPWSWIARKIGKAINHEVVAKVEGIARDVK